MTYEQKFQEILEFQGMYKNGFSALYLAEEQIDFLIEYVWELREQNENQENETKRLKQALAGALQAVEVYSGKTAQAAMEQLIEVAEGPE